MRLSCDIGPLLPSICGHKNAGFEWVIGLSPRGVMRSSRNFGPLLRSVCEPEDARFEWFIGLSPCGAARSYSDLGPPLFECLRTQGCRLRVSHWPLTAWGGKVSSNLGPLLLSVCELEDTGFKWVIGLSPRRAARSTLGLSSRVFANPRMQASSESLASCHAGQRGHLATLGLSSRVFVNLRMQASSESLASCCMGRRGHLTTLGLSSRVFVNPRM
jgi:hypothetical protein